jgi:threonine synthase
MSKVMFFSTNGHPEKVDFRQALLRGQAPDKGLYLPERIPILPIEKIREFSKMSYPEIAYAVIKPYLGDLVTDKELMAMFQEAYNFEVPIEKVFDGKYILRLDRGPTCSFKDFAARFMGRMMQFFLRQEKSELAILTATSGDTGSAVANAFYGQENIRVVILFPENEVTERQRRQMTTLGENIYPVAIDGKFDDCQALVKQAFTDPELKELNLSSANSINIGRLIPQAVYYFYSYSRVAKNGEKAVFSVPSGNFGDLMGGLIAFRMGLPVHKFVAATNENNEFPAFLSSGSYKSLRPSKNCISNAMNVGHPSNLARIVSLYGGQMDELGCIKRQPDMNAMRKDIFGVSISDEETRKTIREFYGKYKIILEPHGAVGWSGLMSYLSAEGDEKLCISLETADPAKFPSEIVKAIGINPPVPAAISGLDKMTEKFETMDKDYAKLKEYIQVLV